MIRTFDFFGNPETPSFTLCNPNKTELCSLGLMFETKLKMKYNAIGDFSFKFPKSIDGGETEVDAYSQIKNKRLVLIEGYGYYVIDDVQENSDGSQPVKEVSCKSLEYELVSKRVSAYGGTVKLYDIMNPEGTLLYDMLQLAPNWTVDSVDTSLLTKFRTFNISDSTVYSVLSTDVATAFECIFVFDTINRKVSAISYENATSMTDIFISFDNLIEESSFSEKTDEITTCLSVYGGGSLNIRGVNPLGTDKIYDFSYYKNTDWMSQSLVDAINNWEILLQTQQPIYADTLALLKTYNEEILDLQSAYTQLQNEYLSLEGVKKIRIETGEDLTEINAELLLKQLQIENQNVLIENKQIQINQVKQDLVDINNLVSFENTDNFSEEELLELNNFIYENTYQNENIIKTDIMTVVEVQDAQQDLYNQGKVVLSRISQPRYEIELNSINYTELEEFGEFIKQTNLGSTVNVSLEEESNIVVVLLEVSMSFDDPEDFSMTFSNRLRLDGGDFVYSDLFGSVVKTGSAVSFDSLKWSNWENNYKDDVTTFISSALDTTTNNLINNSNQEILINQNGLRGRTLNPETNQYDDTQIWLTSSVLAFTDDGFQTSKLALGSIETPAGNKFGIVAEAIFGNLIAGNTLTIANENNNFVLDGTGATLNNAKFNIQTTNTKVIIDPTATNSFVIQKNEGGTFNNKFWVNNAGDVNFSGNLTGATGTFSGSITATTGSLGGWIINSSGISDSFGNYINSNGSIKLGGLTISGSTATFNGNIIATNLVGNVDWNNITNVPANRVAYGGSNGTMSGNAIYGGNPYLSGIGTTGGSLSISGAVSISQQLTVGSSLLTGGGITANGASFINSSLYVGGTLYINETDTPGGTGTTANLTVVTPSGNRTLRFSRGICYATF